jgi:predicted phage gp36 major capsid-like protein
MRRLGAGVLIVLNLFSSWKTNRICDMQRRLKECRTSIPHLGIDDAEAIFRNVQRNHAVLEGNSSVLAILKAGRDVSALEKVIYHQKKLQEIASQN